MVGDLFLVVPDTDILTDHGTGDILGSLLCYPESVLIAFLAKVTPDNEITATLQENPDSLGGVILKPSWKSNGSSDRCRWSPLGTEACILAVLLSLLQL